MSYAAGDIVIAADPYGSGSGRPYLVISNTSHPFEQEECIAVVVTTTSRTAAVTLESSDFQQGSLPKQSYASPWSPVTVKIDMIRKHVATVSPSVVDDVVRELNKYVGTS